MRPQNYGAVDFHEENCYMLGRGEGYQGKDDITQAQCTKAGGKWKQAYTMGIPAFNLDGDWVGTCEVCDAGGSGTRADDTTDAAGNVVEGEILTYDPGIIGTAGLKVALAGIRSAKTKTKSQMTTLLGWVSKAYEYETGNPISLSSLGSVPAEAKSSSDIAAYATVYKTLVKSKLTNAPQTAEAVSKGAAKWFWDNVEKPSLARGTGTTASDGSSGSSRKSSVVNPYTVGYSAFQLRPFFRKNNLWMYATGVLVVGGAAWWFWPDD
jgi:hypothetical protein